MDIIRNTKPDSYQPSFALRQFVQALLSGEVGGNKTKAEMVSGVRRQRFYNNMAKPEFRNWFNAQCDKVLLVNQARVTSALMSSIVKGDVSAIRTYYELIGKLKNKLERSGRLGGGDVTLNLAHTRTIVFSDILQEDENERIKEGVENG